jgi:hypothetical protein
VAPVLHPLLSMVYNEETGRYINMLERKLTVMTFENLKMRSLLELLTGDMWDDCKFDAEDKVIHDLAVDTLVKRLRISRIEARRIVDARFDNANPPELSEDARTYMIDKPERATYITHSRPIAEPAPFDHKKHLQGLARARQRREASTLRREPTQAVDLEPMP